MPGPTATLFPNVQVSPRGLKRAYGHPVFTTGVLHVFNDGPEGTWWSPGTVIVCGAGANRFPAGILPPNAEADPIILFGDVASEPLDYAFFPVVGIALDYCYPKEWGRVACSGVVPVRCRSAATDTALGTVGTWVRTSIDLDDAIDDGFGGLGVVESITPTNLVSTAPDTSTPGAIVGQVVVGAGTGANKTGSNFVAIVELKLR